jgi:CMP-N,N'-diacetyllegionaminic acid synthase
MKKLCIIPARGGSKRLPGKNIKKLHKLPLICHTIKNTYQEFDKIIVSSYSDEILNVCDKYIQKEIQKISNKIQKANKESNLDKALLLGEKIHRLQNIELAIRPKELAEDTSKVIDTVLYYANQERDNFEQVWLCLPTCPLRSKNDVKGAIELYENNSNINSVISITDFEFPPSLGLYKSESNKIWSYHPTDPWESGNTRSQDHERIYRPNGAIYGSSIKSLLKNKNYYLGTVLGYYMPRERSIDIDTELDFKIAEAII